MKKKLIMFFFVFFIIVLIISCNKEPIKVGVITALSGKSSSSGKSLINALNLFIKENNLRNELEIIPSDDSWDNNNMEKAYTFLKNKKIKYIIFGTTSTSFNKVYRKLKEDNILGLVISATAPKFKNENDRVIRTIQDTEKEQKSIAEFLNSRKIDDLYIILDVSNPEYTKIALQYFSTYFKGKINVLSVNFKEENYLDIIKNNYNQKYQNVYIIAGLIGETGLTIQQLKTINKNVNIILVPWTRSKGLEISTGTYLNNVILPSHYPFNYSNNFKDFYDKYYKEYHEDPALHSYLGYEIIQIFYEAYKKSNKSPEKIEKFITNNTFKTIFGTIKFDKYGETDKHMYFGIYKNNKWIDITNILR
ncbi:hypothetical protein X275_00365 [Marinitoga sp. 1197]|uniref:ABC transporter substrate-binding protein n=1 Tax=Marinitoga sp. 1197 TaxID=1428449 RepID=UPI0006413A7F|nr:ABC transporter substrate-binding protein [Marinitoga sp. 1197]KLO24283.1 hypothetical protein X275_00365 [Marinitoga sp. 1197]